MKEQNQKAEALVEEGLQLYSQGQLDAALAKWQMALAIVPDHHRAREYLKYVEDNRAALEESFLIAKSTSSKLASAEALMRQSREQHSLEEGALSKSNVNTASELLDDIHIEITPPISTGKSSQPTKWKNHTPPARPSPKVRAMIPEAEVLPPPIPDDDLSDDYTPRIDLVELQAKVAESKAAIQANPPTKVSFLDTTSPKKKKSEEVRHTKISGRYAPVVAEEVRRTKISGRHAPVVAEEVRHTKISGRYAPVVAEEVRRTKISGRHAPVVAEAQKLSVKEPSHATHRSVLDRHRKATPLTLIGGQGEANESGFEPQEATPVGICIPEPSRLLRGDPSNKTKPALEKNSSGEDELMIEMMLCRDMDTPSKLSPRVTSSNEIDLTPLQSIEKNTAPSPPPGEKSPVSVANSGDFFISIGGEKKSVSKSEKTRKLENISHAQEINPSRLNSMLSGARQLHEQGTYEGSLWLCERVLALQPDHSEAKSLLESNQQALLQQYHTQLGDLRQIPVVQVPQHEIVWHKLDHRAGFLLSRIDGHLSFEDLLDVCGMSEFEAYRILAQLLNQGVIGPRR